MKRLYTTLLAALLGLTAAMAQGWPARYGGVMLQGFYWDSYDDTQWALLESQADELSQTFDLIWVPQSGNCGGTSMGYDDLYWFPGHYDSSFGTEAQLRSMLATFKAKGLKTLADVVINHRKNLTSWFDFPAETYKGVTYTMTASDICADDDSGATAAEAARQGVSLSSAKDTGEGWGGMRDLDHTSTNVQNCVKAYLKMLLDDMGYAGFRYDMVKGYSGSYTAQYNDYAKPEFSVGECWDGTGTIRNWIDATKVGEQPQSAAFDFQFRYTVRNAANNGNWSRLAQQNDGNWPLVSASYFDGSYRRYAVTFVENHDTERRSNAAQDPLTRDTLAANAYLIAMPGTPCIFLTHWKAYPTELKSMIAARKAAGITNESAYTNVASATTHYANSIDDRLLVVVGNTANYTPSTSQWTRILSGHHYAYYMAKSIETAWASLASSTYEGEQRVTLTAVSATPSARLVYTLDGSAPVNTSTMVQSGATITIPVGTTTLRVALLKNGVVDGEITRTYVVKEPKGDEPFTVPSFCTVGEGEVCAFFEAPLTWQNTVCCWAWTDSPSDNFTYAERGKWPGATCQLVGTTETGAKVYKWTWDGKKQKNSAATQPEKIIFNNNESPQTADLAFVNGGYYTYDTQTRGQLRGTVTSGIAHIQADDKTSAPVYNLGGQRVWTEGQGASRPLRQGIYIQGGKKKVVR